MRQDGTEPIADDEVLFRRVSERSGWYAPAPNEQVAWVAFRPNLNDRNGLSVWRGKYKSPEEAAAIGARGEHRYFVLHLRAGKLRGAGIVIEPSPAEGGPGHASLTSLSTHAYAADKNAIRELAERIDTRSSRPLRVRSDPSRICSDFAA